MSLLLLKFSLLIWYGVVSTCGHISKSKSVIGFSYQLIGRYVFLVQEWRRCLYSTDCSEIGLVLLKDPGWFYFVSWWFIHSFWLPGLLPTWWKFMLNWLDNEKESWLHILQGIRCSIFQNLFKLTNMHLVDVDCLSENLLSLKRFSRQKVRKFGKEAQVLKEKDLIKSISPSACVPQVLSTCVDQTHAAILLNTCIACPLASILRTPLDETSAQFCTASLIIALEDLHKVWCLQVAYFHCFFLQLLIMLVTSLFCIFVFSV